MVSHWSLIDSKSPRVSKTLSILVDLNNVVVWMVSTRLFSKSSSSCTNPLVTVPRAPITVGIPVTFMLHSFFNSLARSRYLSLFPLSFSFIPWSAGTAKSTIWQVLSFFFCLSLGLVVWPRLDDLFVSQNPREFCASHFLGRILGCACTICSYGQISLSCTIPSGSPFMLCFALSCTLLR